MANEPESMLRVFLPSLLSVILLVPVHISLWLPIGDPHLKELSHRSPKNWTKQFGACSLLLSVVGFHLVWTLLASAQADTLSNTLLASLLLGNILLAPTFLAWSHKLWIIIGLRRPSITHQEVASEPSVGMDDLPSVAIVVPCRNEPLEVVRLTINSVLGLDYPKTKLALVVADNSDEDNGGVEALRQYIKSLASSGLRACLLHRCGTEGFKAANLDLALQGISSDLILFLDVDNSVPSGLLRSHVGTFDRDHKLAFVQYFNIPVSEALGPTAAATANLLEAWKYEEFLRSDFGGWPFFQGHNCLWRTSVLKEIAPLSRSLGGKSLLVEDLDMTMRANQAGKHGRMVWLPAGFWAPLRLRDLESMLVRWCYGSLQVLRKEHAFLMSRCHGTLPMSQYIDLWERLLGRRALALFPFLLTVLPQSGGGTAFLVLCWALISLAGSTYIYVVRGHELPELSRPTAKKMLDIFLLNQFANWCDLRAMLAFLANYQLGWVPTSKETHTDKSRYLGRHTGLMEAMRQLITSFRFPLVVYVTILVYLVLHQLANPFPPAALLAWFPLVVQAVGVIVVIVIHGSAKPTGSEDLMRLASAQRWNCTDEKSQPSLVAEDLWINSAKSELNATCIDAKESFGQSRFISEARQEP